MTRFIILTGLSGAGKTTGLHALEDLGFFAVDNMPPTLWKDLLNQARSSDYHTIAVGIDIRSKEFLKDVEPSLETLIDQGIKPEIIFLDASDDILVKRYNFTRRTHPLGQAPLANDIAQEREALGYLRAHADVVLDTSRFSAKDLIETLWQRLGENRQFRLRIVSFGFKHGVPIDTDNVFDLRALPNPYYEKSLRHIDGRDERVAAYVLEGTLEFYTQMREFIRTLTLMANAAGRSSYTVAVGCTGGQHRSVAIAERLAHDLADIFTCSIEHRDVEIALKEHVGHR